MLSQDYEKDPSGFWNNLDEMCFRGITSHDVLKIDFLISQLYKPPQSNYILPFFFCVFLFLLHFFVLISLLIFIFLSNERSFRAFIFSFIIHILFIDINFSLGSLSFICCCFNMFFV